VLVHDAIALHAKLPMLLDGSLRARAICRRECRYQCQDPGESAHD
jgi:hypothetical protein